MAQIGTDHRPPSRRERKIGPALSLSSIHQYSRSKRSGFSYKKIWLRFSNYIHVMNQQCETKDRMFQLNYCVQTANRTAYKMVKSKMGTCLVCSIFFACCRSAEKHGASIQSAYKFYKHSTAFNRCCWVNSEF